MKVLLATRNDAKLAELRRIVSDLGIEVIGLDEVAPFDEASIAVIVAAGIVAQEPTDRRVDDLERAVGPHPDALVPPADLLARLEVEPVVLLLADDVERSVVVDVAVLEDLHERGAL